MKIYLSQQNYTIGDIEFNIRKIQLDIQKAIEAGGDLIVFSELAICGYPPKDLLEFETFIQKCYDVLNNLAQYSHQIGILIGAPARNPVLEGKNLFNSAYFLHEGEIKQVIHKALLPTYDVFDEYRYFEAGDNFKCIEFKGHKIAVTICEDIWDLEDDPLYRQRPMDTLIHESPSLMINLSASPFDYTHVADRKNTIRKNAVHYNIPIIYCNCVGAQTELIFDGGSLAYNSDGSCCKELPYFKEALDYVQLENGHLHADIQIIEHFNQPLKEETLDPEYNIAEIHEALLFGISDYFKKMNFQRAIVSSSGGIDSAVVLALACEALGATNVHALLQPSQYSSDDSVKDAIQLSENLGTSYDIVYIKDIYDVVTSSLSPIFKDAPIDVTEENIQSRIRGMMVMALSNKYNYILLNTSNKSELATGYGTLYGDMAGGIGILGDLYKTQVYALARYINREREIIPINIIEKAPSAELRPDQKDSDSLPPYELLDQILYQFIERKQGLKNLLSLNFPEKESKRILQMVSRNEYKRHQFCPILRISPKAFGSGRRMPIVAKYNF